MPFWHGDRLGRPVELGQAVGEFLRTIRDEEMQPTAGAENMLVERHCLDPLAAKNLLMYIDEQVQATGTLPTDRTIVVERFRDEIGDWRICIHSPFGTPVHAPWAMAIERRLAERFDMPVTEGDDPIEINPDILDELAL